MEYVIVRFPKRRKVYIDGVDTDQMTNERISVGPPGPYTFSLGEPVDYIAPANPVTVQGTTPARPMDIVFIQIRGLVGAESVRSNARVFVEETSRPKKSAAKKSPAKKAPAKKAAPKAATKKLSAKKRTKGRK